MSPRVVLIGLPGAGKSTTGKRLARILGTEFADSDDLVQQATGRSVGQLFAEAGEPAFRAAEVAAIADALASFDGVLALGGGALGEPATRAALASCGVPVVLLRAGLETLAARVGDASSRPLLVDDPTGRLAELDAARDPLYQQCATIVVDTEARTPIHVAAQIAARLHEHVSR